MIIPETPSYGRVPKREAAGFTQEQLAEKLDISCGSLSRIETGRQFVTQTTLENLSKVLKVSVSDLFLYSTHSSTNNEKKIELLQYIETMNNYEIEYFLNQIQVYYKLKPHFKSFT